MDQNSQGSVILTLFVGLIAWVPLRDLFPPLVDLPEHILISKLLWEKVTGFPPRLEISWLLATDCFIVHDGGHPLVQALGDSFVYLQGSGDDAHRLPCPWQSSPCFFALRDRSWKSCILAACIRCRLSLHVFSLLVHRVCYITLAINLSFSRVSHGKVSAFRR